MRYSTIVCLDDLVRDAFWPAKEFIYDLIRVPLFQASGLNIHKSPRREQRNNLKPGFSAEKFLSLVGPRGDATPWESVYHRLPQPAADYLARHLPENALVISYEMTPALRGLLDARQVDWIDLRLSPLRFASDLYVGLRTSSPEIYAAAFAHSVSATEVMAEASLLAARLRYRRRYEPVKGAFDNVCVYLGQTENDASLLNDQGRFVRAADHADTLKKLAAIGGLQYKAHPMGGEFATAERLALERMVDARVPLCELPTYELLACEDDISFAGISSGALQEAAWFGRPTYAMLQPLCVPRFEADFSAEGYLQIASHVFMSEPLWAAALGTTGRNAQPLVLPPRANHLRELHNTWWGYASVTLARSEYNREAFAQAGGRRQGDTLRRLEGELTQSREEVQALKGELAQIKAMLQAGAVGAASLDNGHRLPARAIPRAA